MDDLVEWLKRQLDEDERVAKQAAEAHPAPWRIDATTESVVDADGDNLGTGYDGMWEEVFGDHAEHISRHDPARVLREVEAKRRRLQRHQPVEDWVGHDHMPAGRRLIGVNCSTCRDGTCGDDYDIYCAPIAWPCPEIRDDMSVYSDRPGYQEDWRPA